jgi:hypothetical protein
MGSAARHRATDEPHFRSLVIRFQSAERVWSVKIARVLTASLRNVRGRRDRINSGGCCLQAGERSGQSSERAIQHPQQLVGFNAPG